MGGRISPKKLPNPIVRNKPTILNSASNTIDIGTDAHRDLYEHLRQEAIKNEEIQKSKREAASSLLKSAQQCFTKTTINQENKRKMLKFIENKNLVSLHEYMEENKIAPHEELSDEGYYWTSIHYACQNNSKVLLEYLCRLAFQNYPSDYEKIINSQTYEGYTPLIIIARDGELDLAQTFLNFGGVDIEIQDKKNATAQGNAITCKKKDIALLLISKKDFKSTNKKELESLNAEKYFEQWKNTLLAKRESKISWLDYPTNEETMKAILAPNTSDIFKITTQCIESSQNFVDSTFPHNLQDFVSKKNSEKYAQWSLARWLRPHEIFGVNYAEIKLFENIDYNSIKQGSLDTCHFLSVISGLSGFPDRVKKIFQQKEINKYGAYALNFYLNGKPKEVIIDDYFPCFVDKLEAIFAKPNGKQVWVPILEKAWCKMFGTYSIVEIEVVYEAMEDILGAPSTGYWLKTLEINKAFQKLIEWFQNNFLISATTSPDVSEIEGLISNHTYSILGIYEVDGRRLIKLRNPLGYFEWKGEFKDESKQLTEEIKTATNYPLQIDDGIFLMALEEFYYKFAHVSVCFYYDNWIYQYLEMNTIKSSYFLIKVDKAQEISIRVHQENRKLYNEEMSDYKYSPLEMILFSQQDKFIATGADGKYVGAKSIIINNEGFINLQKGEYYLRVKVHFPKNKAKPYVVSTYSAQKVLFESMEYQVGKQMFFETLAEIGKTFENPVRFQGQKCELRFDWLDHLGVIYLRNDLGNPWKVAILIEDDVNLKIGKKGRSGPKESKELKIELKPNSEEAFLVKKIELYKTAKFTKKIFESQY